MTLYYTSLYYPPAPTTVFLYPSTIPQAGGNLALQVYRDPLGIFPSGNNGSATILQGGFYRVDGYLLLTDVGATPNPPTPGWQVGLQMVASKSGNQHTMQWSTASSLKTTARFSDSILLAAGDVLSLYAIGQQGAVGFTDGHFTISYSPGE